MSGKISCKSTSVAGPNILSIIFVGIFDWRKMVSWRFAGRLHAGGGGRLSGLCSTSSSSSVESSVSIIPNEYGFCLLFDGSAAASLVSLATHELDSSVLKNIALHWLVAVPFVWFCNGVDLSAGTNERETSDDDELVINDSLNFSRAIGLNGVALIVLLGFWIVAVSWLFSLSLLKWFYKTENNSRREYSNAANRIVLPLILFSLLQLRCLKCLAKPGKLQTQGCCYCCRVWFQETGKCEKQSSYSYLFYCQFCVYFARLQLRFVSR